MDWVWTLRIESCTGPTRVVILLSELQWTGKIDLWSSTWPMIPSPMWCQEPSLLIQKTGKTQRQFRWYCFSYYNIGSIMVFYWEGYKKLHVIKYSLKKISQTRKMPNIKSLTTNSSPTQQNVTQTATSPSSSYFTLDVFRVIHVFGLIPATYTGQRSVVHPKLNGLTPMAHHAKFSWTQTSSGQMDWRWI